MCSVILVCIAIPAAHEGVLAGAGIVKLVGYHSQTELAQLVEKYIQENSSEDQVIAKQDLRLKNKGLGVIYCIRY